MCIVSFLYSPSKQVGVSFVLSRLHRSVRVLTIWRFRALSVLIEDDLKMISRLVFMSNLASTEKSVIDRAKY